MNHPIKHTNHPDKTILASIVSIMQIGTQFLFLHKVCAHCNICGSKKVDKLAKAGNYPILGSLRMVAFYGTNPI
jgi:hypothetical protein